MEEPGTQRRVLAPGYLSAPLRYTVTNQKGGQGKTTTTVALAAEFAAAGRRTRIIDADPQMASLTLWLPPQWDQAPQDQRYDISHVLLNQVPVDQATWPTGIPNLEIVPSFKTATQFDVMRPPGADFALREALDESAGYDVTIIDCPPNLGQLTVSAITAADDAIIPVLPGGLDLAGVADLNQTMALVKRRLNPNIRVAAVTLRRVRKTTFGSAIEKQLLADYPEAIFKVIRHAVRVEEAPTANKTLLDYAPDSTSAFDYNDLAWRLDQHARDEAARS